MVRTNSDGRTHIHRTKIATTMSRLPAIGLDENVIIFLTMLLILYFCISSYPIFTVQGQGDHAKNTKIVLENKK